MKRKTTMCSMQSMVKIVILFFWYSVLAEATTIKMDVALGNKSTDSIYFELFDNVAPITVNNFINYVSSGDYVNSLLHRTAQYSDGSPFIVQGGGFTYNPQYDSDARFYSSFGGNNLDEFADPVTGELGLRPIGETYVVDADNDDIADEDASGNVIVKVNDGLDVVTSRGAILNESSLSNVRGTLSMALLQNDFNSATSHWFVNLNDNTQLDPNTYGDGYTVFGKVLGNGLDFFDTVSDLATSPFTANIHPELSSLPLVDYKLFTIIREENLVRVTNVEVVSTVPVPSAVWLFSSGLIGLIGIARRKKSE